MLLYKNKKRKFPVAGSLFVLVASLVGSDFLASFSQAFRSSEAYGVPYFSRKYNVRCNTCHLIPPVLNQIGENFLANGYQFPDTEHSKKTWPFALWITQRGESQHSRGIDKSFPNKVELISGGPIGNSPVSYFLEWRILSLQTRSDGSLKDRSGRFEDFFLTYDFSNSVNLKVGQYRLLNQVDDSRKLGLSSPLILGAKVADKSGESRRAFAPNGRSPSVSLQHKSLTGTNAADGWFNIASLVFPGELSLPLSNEARDEADLEFDSSPKGIFLESFYRHGLNSVGAHLFLDDGRSLGGILAVHYKGGWFSRLGLGYERAGGNTTGRVTWENEFLPLSFFSVGGRIDHRTVPEGKTSFVTNMNLQWPGSRWTLRLVLEQRVQTDNHATLAEMSLIF